MKAHFIRRLFLPQLIPPSFALVVLLSLLSPAGAATIIDQQQTSGSFNSFPVDYWGQTFTPTESTIVGIDLNFGLAGSYNVSIRNTSNGTSYPGGILVQTGFVSLAAGIQHLDFATVTALTPGVQYLIRVDDSTPSFIGDYYVKGQAASNPYSGGTAIDPNYGSNGTFGHDWYFVTYALPEPGRTLLAVGGFSCVLLVRRRKQDLYHL